MPCSSRGTEQTPGRESTGWIWHRRSLPSLVGDLVGEGKTGILYDLLVGFDPDYSRISALNPFLVGRSGGLCSSALTCWYFETHGLHNELDEGAGTTLGASKKAAPREIVHRWKTPLSSTDSPTGPLWCLAQEDIYLRNSINVLRFQH